VDFLLAIVSIEQDFPPHPSSGGAEDGTLSVDIPGTRIEGILFAKISGTRRAVASKTWIGFDTSYYLTPVGILTLNSFDSVVANIDFS
jgi:hypothetical protein